MSLIHDCEDKLKIIPLTEEENNEVDAAETKRARNFTFKLCGIELWKEIEFCNPADEKPGQTFKVVDDRNVEYQGKFWSLSALASEFTGNKSVAGPCYFKYKGEWLNDIKFSEQKIVLRNILMKN